jgi:hypothetical protein
MSKRRSLLGVSVFSLCLAAPVALGLNNRSAVSVNGLDTNPCTPASPCRSFSSAIAQTNPDGEIIALDSAGYGPFAITIPLTISGAPGVHAAITTTSGDGIVVNTGYGLGTRATLRNLVLIGAGGDDGINHLSGNELRVMGCLIRGFNAYGILGQNDAGTLFVDRTDVLDNVNAVGIAARGHVHDVITNSSIEGNLVGVHTEYDTTVAVVNTTITGSGIGVDATAAIGSGNSAVMLERCVIAHNATAISASASGGNNVARVTMSQTVVAFNTTAVATSGAGAVDSFANNRFVQNGTDGGPFGSVAFQ